MSYTTKHWRKRYSQRTDLTTGLVHLTRAEDDNAMVKLIYKILSEKKLIGSTTTGGFIVGNDSAVCFQDTPLNAICQNVWFEQKYREVNPKAKRRYSSCGFMFAKTDIYCQGGRPVIYDKTVDAKAYLAESEWWRIVNLDLSNPNNIIDWTHEREWRLKGDHHFELEQITLILSNSRMYHAFIEECDKQGQPLYKQVAGIVNMQNLLF
ncbi:hypothetical protein [Shewanella waksmanii]|uniref:hypothetical protein n=1 Tax=Shewanella waksmanii TaxID=213783 RepID=UPI0037370FE4